jgi:alpha-glucosidase (family GH31 glycosyl hydrolase)
VMQYHSEFNNHSEPHVDRTPWNIAERNDTPEVIDIYRMYAKLRQGMLPYILQEAAYCTRTGEPLMRPLLIDSPEDPAAWKIGDEYRFGRALLVAPILHEGETGRKVYLPEGNWIDVWTGSAHRGPVWIEKQADLSIIPLFRDQDAAWPLDELLFSDACRLAFL